jgi:thioredoxin-like negative regulator of GroEL
VRCAPAGLLYFGGSDPQGCSTAARLAQLGSERDLQRLTSSAQLSVVAFTMHAAPPCIRAYARLYAVAQQHAAAPPAALAFGVLDVDASPAAAAVGAKLGLEQLPTYVLYSGGEEVARLSTSPDRRRLAAVLAHTLAAAAAAPAAAAAAAAAAPAPASPAAGKGS